jgi:dienelactone hydrolase
MTATEIRPTTRTEDSTSPEQRARQVIDSLAAEEFAYVRHYFSAEITGPPATELPTVWDQLTAMFGEFEDCSSVNDPPVPEAAEALSADTTVHLRITLQGGTFGAVVGFDEDGLITALELAKTENDDIVGRVSSSLKIGQFVVNKAVANGLTRLRDRLPGTESGPITPDERREFALSMLDWLADEQYERVAETLGPEIRDQLPPEQLAQAASKCLDSGYESVESVTYDEDEAVVSANVDNGTEKLKYIVKFDEYGRVTGLMFTPPEAGTPGDYDPPEYVDETAFIERSFAVGADGSLDGTLAVPRGTGPYPAVVIVHGSGTSDKNGTMGANKPYRDIAQGLATRGVATLRYDKRPYTDETLSPEDRVVADAVDAVKRLTQDPAVQSDQVVVVGHSLGGYFATKIATESEAAGAVGLAAPCGDMFELVVEQVRILERRDKTDTTVEEAETMLEAVQSGDSAPDETILGYPAAFWSSLDAYDLKSQLRETDFPVMVCLAGEDWRISETEVELWRSLADEDIVELHHYDGCNHSFIETDQAMVDAGSEQGHPTEAVIRDLATFVTAGREGGSR